MLRFDLFLMPKQILNLSNPVLKAINEVSDLLHSSSYLGKSN